MKKFKDQSNYDYLKDGNYEIPIGESMTIPDEAMTISELVKRAQNGMQLAVGRKGYYSDTDDFEETEPIINDLTDLDELVDQLELANEAIQNAIGKKNAEKAIAEKDKIIAEYKAEKKRKSDSEKSEKKELKKNDETTDKAISE
jgi:hypothetical protein